MVVNRRDRYAPIPLARWTEMAPRRVAIVVELVGRDAGRAGDVVNWLSICRHGEIGHPVATRVDTHPPTKLIQTPTCLGLHSIIHLNSSHL